MLLSSVAEHIYWMSRYIERAENTARIILFHNNLMLDMPRRIPIGWEPLVYIMGAMETFREHYEDASERNVVRFLVSNRSNPSCISCSLGQARENLRTIRAIVPRAAWEALNDLYEFSRENSTSGINRRGRYAYMKRVIDSCQLLAGKLSGTMNHDMTYEFLRIGRFMERADMTSRVIDVRATNLLPKLTDELKPFDDIQWKSVLDLLMAYQMYRRRVHVGVRGREVLRFLLQEEDFPRSIHYCLAEVGHCMHRLPGNESVLRVLGRAQRLAQEFDFGGSITDVLNDFINELQLVHAEVHEQLVASYFEVP
ncbi:MAG: alpha-E domain-containing protein, partial [Thiohalobacterales bacterium]|nr:alpha-E domain-containing protein [Thiohalobacterales bacterium]